jgi:hypothetical protein
MLRRGFRDWPLGSGGCRAGRRPGWASTTCPRVIGGTHPGRSSCVRNAVTPSRSGQKVLPGKPTVRRAQFLGGNRMTEKRNAPRGALLYPRRSREELEGGFLGPMAYPDPKGERNSSMPAKRWAAQVSGLSCRGTRVIWRKLNCLNPNLRTTKLGVRRKDTCYRRHALRRHRSLVVATFGAWSVVQ